MYRLTVQTLPDGLETHYSHRLTRHRQHCLVVSGGRCELGFTRRVRWSHWSRAPATLRADWLQRKLGRLLKCGWLGGRVVSVLDSGAEGPGSNRSRDAVG